jgi:hypothetical protein
MRIIRIFELPMNSAPRTRTQPLYQSTIPLPWKSGQSDFRHSGVFTVSARVDLLTAEELRVGSGAVTRHATYDEKSEAKK